MDFDAATFVVHLMQGGRLKPDEKQSAKPRGGLARWVFADGSALLLTEAGTEKRAGVWVREGELADLEAQEPLEGLGPDADQVDDAALAAICKAHSMRLHGLLRDQRAIAGIGRRLANEICHRAKLSPFANAVEARRRRGRRAARRPSVACIDESLAYERGRDDMSSSKERPGERAPPRRRDLPGVRRRRPRGRVRALHGELLRDLPDRRQGAGRQHHQQVPQVAAPAATAEPVPTRTGALASRSGPDARWVVVRIR